MDFEKLSAAVKKRRSPHGRMIGLSIDRCEPGIAHTHVPYHPVFAGDATTGVVHGGLVTTMLDESCGAAVQLALEYPAAIATLDLRIDYMQPAAPGKDIRARAHCYRITRSIAFLRAIAYQDSEDNVIASAASAFMVGANRTDMFGGREPKVTYDMMPKLELPPGDSDGVFGSSPYTRFLGIAARPDGTTVMPYDVRLTGNPMLPAHHGGTIGTFLETTANVGVMREIGGATQPKLVGLTINYLRSGRPVDTFGSTKIVKQGRRVVAFETQAWQTDPAAPIATAYGHFLLKSDHGAEED